MTPADREPQTHVEDPFAHDDAAYVLGLLTGARRDAFEEHLAQCADCAARVTTLGPTATALTHLAPAGRPTPDAAGPAVAGSAPGHRPHTARRRRTRLRAALVGTSTAAAAAVTALVLVLVLGTGHSGGTATPSALAGRTMTAVTSTPLRAEVALADTAWGTRITVNCRYASPGAYPGGRGVYTLQVVDTAGVRHRLGSWTQSGQDVRFVAGTALSETRLRAVQVALPDGTAVLTLPTR